MSISKSTFKNALFLIGIVLLIIPQTRKPIQVYLLKGVALFAPSVESSEEVRTIPDYKWLLQDENNRTFNFQSVKGQVVLLNFWATWCPPCIAEMPGMQALYNDYKNSMVFVFVTEDDLEVVHTFMQKHDYNFKVYRPISAYPEFFKVSTIPRTFLLDKQGRIIIDASRAANWNSETVRKTIDELLNR